VIGKAGENHAVDAGVAAVLGAAIGGGLAGLTAIGTSWFNLRVARLQHQAQEYESARQRRFESIRERREPRAKAYADFMARSDEVVNVIIEGRENVAEAVMEHLKELHRLHAAVAIWGPEPVATAAAEVVAATALMMGRIKLEQPPVAIQVEWSSLVSDALLKFVEEARTALEDDGDETSRSG
jgi:ferredoxin-NADP reductase